VLPTLFYGSENWTIKARDATRITVAEMGMSMRTTALRQIIKLIQRLQRN
jgi:hypothetical protein